MSFDVAHESSYRAEVDYEEAPEDIWTDLLEDLIGHEPDVDPALYRSLVERLSWEHIEAMVHAGVRLVLTKPIVTERPCEECGVVGKVVAQTFHANCECLPW